MTANRRPLPREVRVIAGAFRRTKLPVADVPGLRPTPDRVRETLFNWLGQTLKGRRCLDAFAGTGALGFEAASRGATEVVLVEREAALVRSLVATKERLRADAVRVERADALAWMARAPEAAFDVVFLDPPFDSKLLVPALAAAKRLVAPGGFVYVESGEPIDPGGGIGAAAAGAPSTDVGSGSLAAFELSTDAGGSAAIGELATWRQARAGAVFFQLLRKGVSA